MKIKIYINKTALEFDTEGSERLQVAIIKKLYEHELLIAKNKTDAVYNVSAMLNVGISTVWKVLKECKK